MWSFHLDMFFVCWIICGRLQRLRGSDPWLRKKKGLSLSPFRLFSLHWTLHVTGSFVPQTLARNPPSYSSMQSMSCCNGACWRCCHHLSIVLRPSEQLLVQLLSISGSSFNFAILSDKETFWTCRFECSDRTPSRKKRRQIAQMEIKGCYNWSRSGESAGNSSYCGDTSYLLSGDCYFFFLLGFIVQYTRKIELGSIVIIFLFICLTLGWLGYMDFCTTWSEKFLILRSFNIMLRNMSIEFPWHCRDPFTWPFGEYFCKLSPRP